jgi:hypothetical protein
MFVVFGNPVFAHFPAELGNIRKGSYEKEEAKHEVRHGDRSQIMRWVHGLYIARKTGNYSQPSIPGTL